MSNKKLLHIVCDYKAGGMEFGEIVTSLYQHLNNPDQVLIHHTEVPPLDTVGLGFVTAQYALAPFQGRRVVYGNAAPRRIESKAQKDNLGEGIKYALLNNGTEVINVYSDYAFGFMKNHIVELREVECPAAGSQFRSRDFFPERVAYLLNGDKRYLGKKLDVNKIPEIPSNQVAWTDGFGNIKTTMRASHLKSLGFEPGEKVRITLNGVSMIGIIAVGGFAVDRGVLAINLGSSGYDDPFVELFLRVHYMSEQTAAVRFGYPVGGAEFEIDAL